MCLIGCPPTHFGKHPSFIQPQYSPRRVYSSRRLCQKWSCTARAFGPEPVQQASVAAFATEGSFVGCHPAPSTIVQVWFVLRRGWMKTASKSVLKEDEDTGTIRAQSISMSFTGVNEINDVIHKTPKKIFQTIITQFQKPSMDSFLTIKRTYLLKYIWRKYKKTPLIWLQNLFRSLAHTYLRAHGHELRS